MTSANDSVPTPTLTRRQLQGERSKQDILDAAAALMSTRGYSGTSISELAKESGLPASSIYWHFESKAGVLAAVMERGAQYFVDNMRDTRLSDDPDPYRRLLFTMRHSHRSVMAHPDFLRLFMLLLLGESDVGGQIQSADAVVARVRQEARAAMADALRFAYLPWGPAIADELAANLTDLALALFDGSFIAGQATSTTDTDRIIEQLVTAVHTLACRARDNRA